MVTTLLDNYEEDFGLLPVPAVKKAKEKLFLMQQPVCKVCFSFVLLFSKTVHQKYSDVPAHHHPMGYFKMKRPGGKEKL